MIKILYYLLSALNNDLNSLVKYLREFHSNEIEYMFWIVSIT
jgi:hypothetical protein